MGVVAVSGSDRENDERTPDVDGEDGMASRGVAIELVVGDLPVGLPLEEHGERLLLRPHHLLTQILHMRSAVFVLDEGESFGDRVGGGQRREQINERVLVDLDERDRHSRLELRVLVHVREDVRHRARRDASVLV